MNARLRLAELPATIPLIMRRFSLTVLCSALAALASPNLAVAQCHPASLLGEAPDASSPYSYLLNLTKALSSANEGADQIKDDANPIQLLAAFRATKAGYDCAAFLVAPFLESGNEAISTSAMAASEAFTAAAQNYDEMRKHFAQAIDAVSAGTFKPGTAADRSAAIMQAIDQAGQLLLTAAIAATYSAVEADPSTRKMSGLAMTAPQRDKLKGELVSAFGPDVVKGASAGQSRLFGAAALIHQVISDPQRKPRSQF